MDDQRGGVAGASTNADKASRAHTLKVKAIREVKIFLIMTLYLWVMFALFQLYGSLLREEYHVTLTSNGLAIVNALIFAKVMLVADDLHLGRGLERKALVYPIAIKAVLFAIVFVLFHILEKAIGAAISGKTIAQSMPMLASAGFRGLFTLTAIVTIALLPFFFYSEIARIIGPSELRNMIFKARHAGAPSQG